jgi:hypothetical protein
MQRRKFVLGLGSLTAAGAATIGSGAFTTAEATRDASVEVADDATGYLAMQASGGPNGRYASQASDGTIGLDFSGSGNGGSGVGTTSEYNFDNVFQITNQGTQTVYVWVNFSGSNFDDSNLYLYPNGSRETKLNDGQNSVLTLGSGESADIGVHVDTDAGTSTGSPTMTINADVDKPTNSGSIGPGGDEALVVSQDGDVGDFSSIQDAIDAATGTTVLVQPGTYTENVDVPGSNTPSNVQGLTLKSTTGPAQTTINGRVNIGVNDVVFDGFTVSPPAATDSTGSEAIKASGSPDGVTIVNNIVKNFQRDINNADSDFWGTDGINVFGGSSSDPITGITINNNTVQNVSNADQGGSTGISIQGNVDGATVKNNTTTEIGLDENGNQVNSYAFGVVIRGTENHSVLPKNIDVLGNSVSDVLADTSSQFLGVGFGVESDGSNYVASNNTIENVNIGVEIKEAATDLDFTGNSLNSIDGSNTGSTQLYLGNQDTDNAPIQSIISNNTFDKNVTSGGPLGSYNQTIQAQ